MARISKKAYWNEARTKDLLRTSDRAVEAAILVLYNNQTSAEQVAETTNVDNGIGFSGTDAEFGTSLAKQILARRVSWEQEHNALSPKQIPFARKIALHHWSQFAFSLNEERKDKGLPTEAPALPEGVEPEAVPAHDSNDRFTWKPGDLHTAADGERYEHGYKEPLFEESVPEAPREYELFEEDDEKPLRDLGELAKAHRGAHATVFEREVLQSPEWQLMLEVLNKESDAWLRLTYAASCRKQPWGTVPSLAQRYRNAEARRQAVLKQLGLADAAKPSESYSAKWTKRFGGTSRAVDYWLDSVEGKRWVADNIPATLLVGVTK